jgi:hypothetical protein
MCTKQCILNVCQCIRDHVRNANDECVHKTQCNIHKRVEKSSDEIQNEDAQEQQVTNVELEENNEDKSPEIVGNRESVVHHEHEDSPSAHANRREHPDEETSGIYFEYI